MLLVVQAILCVTVVGGEELVAVCFNFLDPAKDLVTFTHPDGRLPEIPHFLGSLELWTEKQTIDHSHLGGLHVSAKDTTYFISLHSVYDGEIFGSTSRRRDSFDSNTPNPGTLIPTNHQNGGMTVIRKYTNYSPNGRINPQSGWLDTTYTSAPGPGLTGDCEGYLYQWDQRTGFLVKMDPDTGTTSSVGVYNPNAAGLSPNATKATLGLTYNPVNGHFYTAYFGLVPESANVTTEVSALYITEIDPIAATAVTSYIPLFEGRYFVDTAVLTEDSLEISADGSSLWLMVSYPTGADVHSSGRSEFAQIFPKFAERIRQEEMDQIKFGRNGPILFTGLLSINLETQVITEGEIVFGVICAGLSHTHNPCPVETVRIFLFATHVLTMFSP